MENGFIQIGPPPDFKGVFYQVTTDKFENKCDICGKPAFVQTWIDGELMATRCYEHPYDPYNTEINLTSNYNYKCPNCGGEFKEPVSKKLSYFCPFCNMEMKGL